MKKKILVVLMMMLLMTTVGVTSGIIERQENISNSLNNSIEVSDQISPTGENWGWFDSPGEIWAQSFIPDYSPLSRVQLSMFIRGTPPENTNFTLSIRQDLDGEDIVKNTLNSNEIEVGSVDFSLADTELTIGMTYYIVFTADKKSPENDNYCWRGSIGGYEDGHMWWKHDGIQWEPADEEGGKYFDLSFTTYWRDYVPDNPTIDGPPEGKAQERYAYTFSTEDPEGHEVEYQIDWGDGVTTNWLGSYESGEEAEKEHQWAYDGNYTIRIRARDVYGAESDWASMEISMPKTKTFNHPFLQFLNNHPYLFPILKILLNID